MSRILLSTIIMLSVAAPAMAQTDPGGLVAAQTEAMKPLAILDGAWRGPVWTMDRTGKRHDLTQTERVGGFLDGSVKVIEGRGYDADGKVSFNAFAVISYDPPTKTYSMRSYAGGSKGDFPLTLRPDGFSWEIKAGPGVVRYTAVVKDATWVETGEFLMEGQPPRKVLEMSLKRVGGTDWPAAGAVPPK